VAEDRAVRDALWLVFFLLGFLTHLDVRGRADRAALWLVFFLLGFLIADLVHLGYSGRSAVPDSSLPLLGPAAALGGMVFGVPGVIVVLLVACLWPRVRAARGKERR